MSKSRLTVTIEKDVLDRFNASAKKLKINKSAVIEEFIEGILPILEQSKKETMLQKILQAQAKSLNETASLLDYENK